MKSLWRRAGLARKIILLITLILIVPTAGLCAGYYRAYWNSLLLGAEDSLSRSLNALEYAMDDCLDSAEAVLDELDYSEELLYFLETDSLSGPEKTERFLLNLQQKWVDIRYAYPNRFRDFFLYTSNPAMEIRNSWKWYIRPLSAAQESFRPPSARFFYASPQTPAPTADHPAFSTIESRTNVLPVWFPVRDFRTEQAVGAVRLDIPLEKLMDIQAVRDTWPDQAFLLTDREGRVFFSAGVPLPGDIPEGVRFSGDGTAEELRLNGGVWLAAGRTCSRTGLTCVSMVEKAAVIKPASSMLRTCGLAAIAGTALVMFFISVTVRRMLRRLMELDSVMGRTGAGDWSAVLPEDGAEDEVSRIRHSFNVMTIRLRNLIRQTVEQEKAQQEAELRALQAQINPHFLFNTLETMRMQCEIDRYTKVENGLSSLGKLLRYTLRWESNEVPFRQEWSYLQNYLALMSLRWEEDLTCETRCDGSAESVMVPRMVLQPLVENSFQHGFKGVPPPWKLEVRAEREDGRLCVTIRDNGTGIAPDRLESLREVLSHPDRAEPGAGEGHSIGMANVARRVQYLCKDGSGIFIGNRPDSRGAEIILRIVL